MARISSETLFNFTDSIDYLISNLKEGFYCHRTYEKLPKKNNGYRAPMACFCDIPLSLIKEHFNWYGKYGIGLNKAYARSIGLRPVWYVTSESPYVKGLLKRSPLPDYERKYVLPYLKQYIGKQYYEPDKKEKRKKFYNEREWRFISNKNEVEAYFGIVQKRAMTTAVQDAKRMPIDLAKVEYIILKNTNDISNILKVLEDLSKKHSIDYETLVSKLITARQIQLDF